MIIGIVVVLVVFVLTAPGNIFASPNSKIISIGDMIKSPDTYSKLKVNIIGTLYSGPYTTKMNIMGSQMTGYLIDDQGYEITLDKRSCIEDDRTFFLGEKYKARGGLFYDGTCVCECVGSEYTNDFKALELKVLDCWGIADKDCNCVPGSITGEPVFGCTEPMEKL